MTLDRQAVVDRLRRERSIDLCAELIDDVEELTSDHEGDLIRDYGFNALVRYYSPLDPGLPENEKKGGDA